MFVISGLLLPPVTLTIVSSSDDHVVGPSTFTVLPLVSFQVTLNSAIDPDPIVADDFCETA